MYAKQPNHPAYLKNLMNQRGLLIRKIRQNSDGRHSHFNPYGIKVLKRSLVSLEHRLLSQVPKNFLTEQLGMYTIID